MIICIIPARGGSKRIPRKNVKPFGGKPMIEWSIRAARESNVFDHIIVSTDDEEIAQISRKCGAETPFVRPPELCTDHADSVEATCHALRWAQQHLGPVTECCLLYATAPFVTAEDIRAVLEILRARPEADFAFPITTFGFPIFRALKRDSTGMVSMFWPEHEDTRSQDLPEAWHDVGQFYWGRANSFLTKPGLYSENAIGCPIPRWRVQDIDTVEDWELAERLFQSMNHP